MHGKSICLKYNAKLYVNVKKENKKVDRFEIYFLHFFLNTRQSDLKYRSEPDIPSRYQLFIAIT